MHCESELQKKKKFVESDECDKFFVVWTLLVGILISTVS